MITKIKKMVRKALNIFLLFIARITKSDLTTIGYYQKGISKYGNDELTGEKFVIDTILKDKIQKANPIFFDVGANIGQYSLSLRNQFPNSQIYSFEANNKTYEKILTDAWNKDINFFNIGLGSHSGDSIIYDYKGETGTEHASIYKNVLKDIHHSKTIEEIDFKIETLDIFCNNHKIDHIDFIKIDTEGSEFEVLKGSKNMLTQNKIGIIQFEFNEMNVISRVFLKDYFDLLTNYDIYRIDSKRIIPLPIYQTENEIFKYQNFLAINKSYK